MRKTKEEAQETRKAILQSALDTFYEKGYSKTTFDEIAKRIGFTKGAVYWHFRNKPDLVTAIINDYIESQATYVESRLPEIKSIDDILTYYVYTSEFITSSENNRKLAFFMRCQMEWSETLITKVKIGVDTNKQNTLNKIKDALTFLQKSGEISNNANIEQLTYTITGVWNGILGDYLIHLCPFDLQVMIKESLGLIFKGLTKERAENASK
ncbi:MAG: TetR/AcrR family transcriptional regulator [Alphaproteobacteria bacterium]|nr:TetR/AcrR family transcriptional regulator [Alphaproteobacteria bacterium]